MTINYCIEDEDIVKDVDLLLSPVEYLVISSALKKYVEDESNNVSDREIARRMRTAIEDSSEFPNNSTTDVPENNVGKIAPVIRDNGVKNELNRVKDELEPTAKNDPPKYCDRSICLKNEYNNIGCEDCEVTKSQNPTTINGLDDFIEFGKKAFGVELAIKKSDNPDTYEKLFGTTKNDLDVDCVDRNSIKYYPGTGGYMYASKGEIDKLPSVKPQEHRKGQWIESDYLKHRWYCSECGGMHNDPESGEWREVFDFKYDYCPLCGADMRGEE